MTITRVEVAGGTLAYDVTGQGDRTLVCVPGMGDLRTSYRHNVGALVAAGFRVATMDLPGHGDSSDGFTAYDDAVLGQSILGIGDALGGPVSVLGNSMGGSGAVWAASERPGAVDKLVLIGAFVRDPLANWAARAGMRAALLKPWGPALWRGYYRSLNKIKPADLDQHVTDIAAALGRGSHWRSFVKTSQVSHETLEERLAAVRARTLVIMGSKDPDWPDPADEAAFTATALGGESLMIDRAGHYPHAERPEVVNPALITFLTNTTD